MPQRVVDDLSGEELRVRDWRLDQFERLGFSRQQATALAENSEVDVARVRLLLEKGCPKAVAMRIVL